MLFVLLRPRVRGVTMSHERILDRERALRRTGVALASVSTIDGIETIVCKAVRDLIGQRPDCEALFACARTRR